MAEQTLTHMLTGQVLRGKEAAGQLSDGRRKKNKQESVEMWWWGEKKKVDSEEIHGAKLNFMIHVQSVGFTALTQVNLADVCLCVRVGDST